MTSPLRQEVDIAVAARTIDWLQAELVSSAGGLLRAMAVGSDDASTEAMAALVASTYILARRIGVSFERLDQEAVRRLKGHAAEGHELERRYGDLSALAGYLEDRRG
ncbi:MAG: MazG-like family protein [Firmicutes bacterium]|nr:MazG-like family protein [Bacillota bacterium]